MYKNDEFVQICFQKEFMKEIIEFIILNENEFEQNTREMVLLLEIRISY